MSISLADLSPRFQQQATRKLAVQNKGKKSKGKRSKYHAVKTWAYGLCTDSKKEAAYLGRCVLLTKAGALDGFLYHGKFLLVDGTDKDHRAVTYEPDFVLLKPDGTYEIIDTKGVETDLFRDKMKIMRDRYPKVEVKIEK